VGLDRSPVLASIRGVLGAHGQGGYLEEKDDQKDDSPVRSGFIKDYIARFRCVGS